MDGFKVTPMSLSELANAYEVSNKTMRKWLKPYQQAIGERLGQLYTPKQVLQIYECLGYPPISDMK